MKAIAKQSIEFAEAPEHAVKAADAILGANPFVGLDSDQVIEQLTLFVNETLKNPEVLGGQLTKMAVELFKVAAGISDVFRKRATSVSPTLPGPTILSIAA